MNKLTELSTYSGEGTSMITILVAPSSNSRDATVKLITSETTKATNIKSRI